MENHRTVSLFNILDCHIVVVRRILILLLLWSLLTILRINIVICVPKYCVSGSFDLVVVICRFIVTGCYDYLGR